ELKFDQGPIVPVATACMLAPAIMVVVAVRPSPTVGVDGKTEFGTVAVPLLSVPAIAIAIANYCRRCSAHTDGQRARASKKDCSHTFHRLILQLLEFLLKLFGTGLVSADRANLEPRCIPCRSASA